MTSIIGQVEVVMGAVANNTKLTATPTAPGTARDICAVLNTANYAQGDLLGIDGINTSAMLPPASSGTIEGQTVGVVLKPGTLDLDCAANNTGELSWIVHYIPLDAGAVMQAA